MHRKYPFFLILLLSFLFLNSPYQLLAQDEGADNSAPANTESAGAISSDPAVISQGEVLFNGNCKTCHAVHKKVVGPALANVYERRPIEWLYRFIRNSQKVIRSGDKYAVDLYNEYNQTEMTAFDDFTDAEILSILAYIQQETIAGPAGPEPPPGPGGDPQTVEASSDYMKIILAVLVVILLLILLILVMITGVLKKYLTDRNDLDEADKEIVFQKFDLQKVIRSKAFIGIVVFIFAVVVVKASIDGLFNVGVQQGYAPRQPIAFSHKLHAGQYQIDCQYCHTGVRKSKSASIPSANICMNCHGQIKTESPEIQKIYTAIEKNRPIEWVRVHNLPDLAYFNHSQHVEVGDIECQTCHGPIEEMEVVQQHARLTMGWCIDCHQTTAINAKDNAYYDNLVKIHQQENAKEPLRVKDIGGLECSKCHY